MDNVLLNVQEINILKMEDVFGRIHYFKYMLLMEVDNVYNVHI